MIRVEAPLDVDLPRRCCACGTEHGIELVANGQRVLVPLCPACRAHERAAMLRVRVPLLAAAVAILAFGLHPALLSPLFGLWMAYPHLSRRPLRVIHVDANGVALFACRNWVFAEALARVPGARIPPEIDERRVQLPADVPLPLGCCCACGTRDGVAAVARSFRDGLDVWRGQLPYCAPCLAGELEERRAWNRLALRVLPVLFLVAVALGEIPFLGRVAMFVWSAGVLAWLLGPLPDRRPVRMQAADGSHVTWWIANDSYRALVRDAAQHPTL